MTNIEFKYTKSDFEGLAPYAYIEKIEDPFLRQQAVRKLAEYASKEVGFTGFKTMLSAYRKSQKQAAGALFVPDNIIQFDVAGQELESGEWQTQGGQIFRKGPNGKIDVACPHPVAPVERIQNIDTGQWKIKLAFRRGTKQEGWSEIIVDLSTVSNAKNIVSLAERGISVISGERAQNLVEFLNFLIDNNFDTIPISKSVSRLGWNSEGFSPYTEEVIFDGLDKFEGTFNAIKERGNYEKWLAEAVKCRKYSLSARLVIAASFAAPLVKPLGALPFFVHLWSAGGESGTGKTVAQMVAASVWGDPESGGDFFKTCRSTDTGFEIFASFLNSLPVILDDTQHAKDKRGNPSLDVYALTSGGGKLRSNKSLGISSTPIWRNCFITSGETPLISETSAAGEANRVIEIPCSSGKKVIEDGHKTAEITRNNYGFAGKKFIEQLTENIPQAKELYEKYHKECTASKTASKQAMAAAVLLVADNLATNWIFKDGEPLKTDDIAKFLKSEANVSIVDRGYEYICDWVSQNSNKFKASESGDIYGKFDGEDYVYIINAVFNKACGDANINSKALLSGLKAQGKIKTKANGVGYTVPQRIGGAVSSCVCLKMKSEDDEDGELMEEYPF